VGQDVVRQRDVDGAAIGAIASGSGGVSQSSGQQYCGGISFIRSDFVNVIASIMNAAVVYKWLLQTTSNTTFTGRCHRAGSRPVLLRLQRSLGMVS
jgi:hypothetical protein